MQFDSFICACQALSQKRNPVKRIQALMREIMEAPTEVRQSLDSYTPQVCEAPVLFRTKNLFIFHSFLIPNLISPPHTHEMWAIIGLYHGREDNIFYKRNNGTLQEEFRKHLMPGDVILLAEDVIHAVSNPLAEPSLALHVYGGDLPNAERSMWNPWTMKESPFELNQFLTYSLTMMQQTHVSDMGSPT